MKNKIKAFLITDYMKQNNLSKTKFCTLCKISLSTLKKILEGDDDFGFIALYKIAFILNIHAIDLLQS